MAPAAPGERRRGLDFVGSRLSPADAGDVAARSKLTSCPQRSGHWILLWKGFQNILLVLSLITEFVRSLT